MFKIDIEKVQDAVKGLKMIVGLIEQMKREFNLTDDNFRIIVKDNGELQILVIRNDIEIMEICRDGVSIRTDMWLRIDAIELIMEILEWLISPPKQDSRKEDVMEEEILDFVIQYLSK